MALDPVRLTPTKTVVSRGKVNCSESITTVVILKVKIEKGNIVNGLNPGVSVVCLV